MKSYDRMLRVNELLKREISEQIERSIAPQLDGLVTVTRVETAPDLRNAKVFVSFFGPADQSGTLLSLLKKERAHLQSELASHVKIKYTPVLHFTLDKTAANADRVLSILDELDLSADDDTETSSDETADDTEE